jgi:hypothetical protein
MKGAEQQSLIGIDIYPKSFLQPNYHFHHCRKVTVMDISKKHGMDYRLLHAVTSGHPWYGEWGYKFGAGSFALTSETYRTAVDMLSSIHLALYFSNRSPIRTPLQNTIALYWALSDRQLVTLRDLFRFIMHLMFQSFQAEELPDLPNFSDTTP